MLKSFLTFFYLLGLLLFFSFQTTSASTAFLDTISVCSNRYVNCAFLKDQNKYDSDDVYRINTNRCLSELEKVCDKAEFITMANFKDQCTTNNDYCNPQTTCVKIPPLSGSSEAKLANGQVCPFYFENNRENCENSVVFPLQKAALHLDKDPGTRFVIEKPSQIEYVYDPSFYVLRNSQWIALSEINYKVYPGEQIRAEVDITAEWFPPAGYHSATPKAYIKDTLDWSGIDKTCDIKDSTIFSLQGAPGSYHIMNLATPVIFKRPSVLLSAPGWQCNGSNCTVPKSTGSYLLSVETFPTEAAQRFWTFTDMKSADPNEVNPGCLTSSSVTPGELGAADSVFKQFGLNPVAKKYNSTSGPITAKAIIPTWQGQSKNSITIIEPKEVVVDTNELPKSEIFFLNANPNRNFQLNQEIEAKGKIISNGNTGGSIKKIKWLCKDMNGSPEYCKIQGSNNEWAKGEIIEDVSGGRTFTSLIKFKFEKIGNYGISLEAWNDKNLSTTSTVTVNAQEVVEAKDNTSTTNIISNYCEIRLINGKRDKTVCSSNEAVVYKATPPIPSGMKTPVTYKWKCHESETFTESTNNDSNTCYYNNLGSYIPSLTITDAENKSVDCNPVLFGIRRLDPSKKNCKVELRKKGIPNAIFTSKIYISAGVPVEARVVGTCTDGKIFWDVKNGDPHSPNEIQPTITFVAPGYAEVNASIGDLGEFPCQKATAEVKERSAWGL